MRSKICGKWESIVKVCYRIDHHTRFGRKDSSDSGIPKSMGRVKSQVRIQVVQC